MFPDYSKIENQFYCGMYDQYIYELLERISRHTFGVCTISPLDANEFNFWSRLTEDGFTGGDTAPWGGLPGNVWLTDKGRQRLKELEAKK